MHPDSSPSQDSGAVDRMAAEWVLRHDRGLTAAEQDAFSQWLASDPRHRTAWAECRWGWDELDRIAGLQASVHAVPDPDLLAPPPPVRPVRSVRRAALTGVAAVLGLAGFFWLSPASRPTSDGAVPGPVLALIEQRELSDGSVVELNRGAVLTEAFGPAERRVRLERGEAHFTVAKNLARPFVVEAAGVAVRAVGTAFSVRLDSAAVDVVVTEGKVSVAARAMRSVPSEISAAAPLVAAGERTVVSLAPAAPAPQVSRISAAEIEARLAWQPRLLDFNDTPLPEIVAEFNRRNPVRLSLGDPALRAVRLSAAFRSDNVEGFVRLMASDFGMRVERRGDGEMVLRRASGFRPGAADR